MIDVDDPRKAIGLMGHPVRPAIISFLEGRSSASPKEIAAGLGVRLETVAYHVKVLRDAGFIELVRERGGRGPFVERVYALAGKPRLTAEAWSRLPIFIREILNGNNLAQLWRETAAAAATGGMNRPDSLVARLGLRIDPVAYQEIHDILNKAVEEIKAAEMRAAERLDTHETEEQRASVVAMLFDSPDPAVVLALEEGSDTDAPGRRPAAKR